MKRTTLRLLALTALSALWLSGCTSGQPKVRVIPDETPRQAQTLTVQGVNRLAGGFLHDWSPDGQKLVFSAPAEGQEEFGEVRPRILWIMNRDGSGRRALTQPDRTVHNFARWSPDGRLIAFIKGVEESFHLYVIGPDGTEERRLSAEGELVQGYEYNWSSDGKRLVYTGRGAGGLHLVTVDVDTGERKAFPVGRLNGTEPASAPLNPTLLPDGRLLFRAMKSMEDGQNFLYLADARGQVIKAIDQADFFSVSPDGKRVAYVRPSSGEGLFVADLESGQSSRIVDGAAYEPAWSPDGSWIAFGKSPNPQPRDLWVVRPDGTDALQLTSNITASGLRWAPDAKALAFTGWNMSLQPDNPEFTMVYVVTLGTR
ncbi:MAG: TolB family protein [Bacillota bacterium]